MKTKDFYERDLFLNIQFQANTGVCQTYQEKKTFRNFVWSLLKLHFFFILGDVWKKANLPVKVNGEEFQLKFISTSKSGPQGDMAIDKVTLTQAPCGEQSLHNWMGNRGRQTPKMDANANVQVSGCKNFVNARRKIKSLMKVDVLI